VSTPGHRDQRRDPVAVAIELLDAAHRQAMVLTRTNPDSTWIDAASAIGAALGQLLASTGLTVPEPESQPLPAGTCVELLEAAERALEQIPPGDGPVSLALVRSYLTDAIVETAGREP